MQTQIDIDSKITEAEACRSMQLLNDSLRIYEEVLGRLEPQDMTMHARVENRIRLLKQEISDLEGRKPGDMPADEIDSIIGHIPEQDGAEIIFDKAAAFKEMGLHPKAVAEYAKLFREGFNIELFVADLAECLLKLHSPKNAAAEIDQLVKNQNPAQQDLAKIKFLFGRELEKRDHREQALGLYKAAGKLDPDDAEIKKSLESLTAAFTSGSRYDYLLGEGIVTADQLQKAFALSKKTNKSVEHVLIEHFQVKKEAIGKSFSLFYDCSFREYDPDFPVPVELLSKLKKAFLLNEYWVPLSWDKDTIEILVDDPRDLNKTDNIKSLLKTGKINFCVAIREDIQKYIEYFFDAKDSPVETDTEEPAEEDELTAVEWEEEEEENDAEEVDEASGKVVRLVDQIIITAFRKNASDIHIEPSSITKTTTIRFRLDGLCQEYKRVPNSMVRGIVSRIKIMAKLDIAERRKPQDGKIKFRRKGVPAFELRVATIPVAGGYEDVVLRILASAGAMQIDEMGLTARNLEVMKRIIAKPYGLILAVGPTGSGKTTSLHALLGHINKPDIKIWTAEDPIEITQPGLRQTEVKPKIGVDFARMMRAFLRGDPDVIMIGEMRDEETASIGIEASLTGHLVFSTLHTNSAPETITRLLDMGLNPLNFSDAFLGVLAQRLTRRLCLECREQYPLTRDEFEMIRSDYGEDHFAKTGIEYDPDMSLYRPAGCEACSDTGYRGRMGIHELMEGTAEIKLMIKNQASTEKIFEQAINDGMTTLKQDGILKVFQGLTDMAEVRRVCIN
jgi:type II secretory ATPase GspE/PulE/Tfp pilus assembly ATPase PilB-like protein/tetratricopeptide (TPR) repeat protein